MITGVAFWGCGSGGVAVLATALGRMVTGKVAKVAFFAKKTRLYTNIGMLKNSDVNIEPSIYISIFYDTNATIATIPVFMGSVAVAEG